MAAYTKLSSVNTAYYTLDAYEMTNGVLVLRNGVPIDPTGGDPRRTKTIAVATKGQVWRAKAKGPAATATAAEASAQLSPAVEEALIKRHNDASATAAELAAQLEQLTAANASVSPDLCALQEENKKLKYQLGQLTRAVQTM